MQVHQMGVAQNLQMCKQGFLHLHQVISEVWKVT